MTSRFYVGPRADGAAATLLDPLHAEGAVVSLPEAAAHHATRVLRLVTGDAVVLFDGEGGEYLGRLGKPGKRAVDVTIERFDDVERESATRVTLVPALLAADAMDVTLRKAVELGVARIEPVLAARSQQLGAARLAQRVAHWRQVVIGACEQCGRNRVPEVAAPLALADWWSRADASDVVLVPSASVSLAAQLAQAGARSLLVGPEGGFTEGELDAATRAGVRFASLGAAVLRADTAAIAALAIATTGR